MKQLTESMMIQRLGGALCACLLASALLLSCSKTPGQESRGKEIRFGAVTAADPQTKTAYTGVEEGGKERIDWIIGDYVRVYSDKAVCVMNSSQHWADYRLATPMIDPDDHAQSWAEIVPVALTGITYHGGLQWADDSAHDFYGFYPSPKTLDGAEFDSSSKVLTGMEIATSQTVTAATVKDIDHPANDVTVYYPDMQKAYMTAFLHTLSPTESLHEDLVFNPAYTAFHIGFKAQVASKVESVEIKSASSNLTGTYTATHNGSAWTYARTGDAASSTATEVSTQTLDIDLAAGAGLEVELFTLPLDATNLSLYINVKEAGTSKTYILDLKAVSAMTFQGNSYTANQWLNFAACRKVYLRGLLLPGAPWTIDGDTNINVISSAIAPWDQKPDDITYGSGPVINASGLDEVNVDPSLKKYDEYAFSVFAPVDKTWKITVLDEFQQEADDAVTITRLNPKTGSTDPTSNKGHLIGTIGRGPDTAPAQIRFGLSGTGGPYTLTFSVVIDGREYSIDTEVVRGDGSGNGFARGDYHTIQF